MKRIAISIGQYMKSKQLPLIEKCTCLTILPANSVHKFSKIYLSYSLIFTTNNSYFSKMALVGFWYEPVSLDVKEFWLDEEQDIHNTHEKSRKSQSDTK